ncbi:tail fiber assembly protein, partial [Yersinia enterocolitica]
DRSASDKEITALAFWRKYRVALMRIDTSKEPDIEWPASPE